MQKDSILKGSFDKSVRIGGKWAGGNNINQYFNRILI